MLHFALYRRRVAPNSHYAPQLRVLRRAITGYKINIKAMVLCNDSGLRDYSCKDISLHVLARSKATKVPLHLPMNSTKRVTMPWSESTCCWSRVVYGPKPTNSSMTPVFFTERCSESLISLKTQPPCLLYRSMLAILLFSCLRTAAKTEG